MEATQIQQTSTESATRKGRGRGEERVAIKETEEADPGVSELWRSWRVEEQVYQGDDGDEGGCGEVEEGLFLFY